jgi:hypothetical protein
MIDESQKNDGEEELDETEDDEDEKPQDLLGDWNRLNKNPPQVEKPQDFLKDWSRLNKKPPHVGPLKKGGKK